VTSDNIPVPPASDGMLQLLNTLHANHQINSKISYSRLLVLNLMDQRLPPELAGRFA